MRSLVFTLIFAAGLVAAPLHACPLIGGHVDYNCDGKHRVTFTGDSITRGIGDKDRSFETGGYVLDLAQANPESTMLNLGDPGTTARRLFRTIRRNTKRGTPKVIQRLRNADMFMLEVGTNDYWKGTPPKTIVRSIKKTLEYLKNWYEEQGSVVPLFVIGTVPPTKRGYQNPYIRYVNQALLAAKSSQFPVEVRFDKFSPSIIGQDMLHPSARGYLRMSRKVQRWMDRRGTARSLANRHDNDGDGLYDELEAQYFSTDPLVADSDGDGLLDGAEILTYETNPVVNDTDGDGLLDGAEILTHETDPLVADTDSDGLLDGAEVLTHETNPVVADTDGDGLLDGPEVLTHETNPVVADTDGDEVTDSEEITNGTDPNDPLSK
jgi:lysophospholipase L1-like esterase